MSYISSLQKQVEPRRKPLAHIVGTLRPFIMGLAAFAIAVTLYAYYIGENTSAAITFGLAMTTFMLIVICGMLAVLAICWLTAYVIWRIIVKRLE